MDSPADVMVDGSLKKARPSMDQNNGDRYLTTQSLSAILSFGMLKAKNEKRISVFAS